MSPSRVITSYSIHYTKLYDVIASSRFRVDTDKGDNTFCLDDQLLGLNAYLTLRF